MFNKMIREPQVGPFITRSSLILASASPRRKDFLKQLGISFEVVIPAVQEEVFQGEGSGAFVKRIAAEKARFVADARGDSWVLAADTVVVHDNRILGKPVDALAAEEILMSLSGHCHEVLTAFCLCHAGRGVEKTVAVSTEVVFTDFSNDIARAYVNTGEPLDKAGSYGIQGVGGMLVEKINGSYSNVVGLPLAEVVQELLQHGVIAVNNEK
jgi:septum formation protein